MTHPTAEVQSKNIGEGTIVWQYCVILKDAIIGNNCNIDYNVFIENEVTIGNNVTIKCGVQLWDGIHIDNNVFLGPNVTFTNDLLPRSKRIPDKFSKITIKEGASIGANATLIGDITVGCYAMIGAGSVLTKDAPDYSLWYGNPAKCRGYICCCGNKMENDLICGVCNSRYLKENERVIKL